MMQKAAILYEINKLGLVTQLTQHLLFFVILWLVLHDPALIRVNALKFKPFMRFKSKESALPVNVLTVTHRKTRARIQFSFALERTIT
jgi:hypothetical protein